MGADLRLCRIPQRHGRRPPKRVELEPGRRNHVPGVACNKALTHDAAIGRRFVAYPRPTVRSGCLHTSTGATATRLLHHHSRPTQRRVSLQRRLRRRAGRTQCADSTQSGTAVPAAANDRVSLLNSNSAGAASTTPASWAQVGAKNGDGAAKWGRVRARAHIRPRGRRPARCRRAPRPPRPPPCCSSTLAANKAFLR